MMMWRYIIPGTGVYEALESTPSSVNDPYLYVLEYRSYWLSIYVFFALKYILGRVILCLVVVKNVEMVHLMWCIFNFLTICKYWILPFRSKDSLDFITNMIWCWMLCRKNNYSYPLDWMCLILLNMDLFYWIFVLTMFLTLWYLMEWILLNFPVNCLLDIYFIISCTVFVYFPPMLSIHTLFIFPAGKSRFQGLFFVEWDI